MNQQIDNQMDILIKKSNNNNQILDTLKDNLRSKILYKSKKKASDISSEKIKNYLDPVKELFTEQEIKKLSVIYASKARYPTLLGFSRYCRKNFGLTPDELNKAFNKHLSKIQNSLKFEELF